MNIKADSLLDAKGLACPMPLVKTRNEVKKLQPGEVLEVHATDKGSQADIAAWAKSSGEHYLGTIEADGILKHYVRKSNPEEVSEITMYENIVSLDEFAKSYTDSSVVVLDVREPAEYAFGHIPGSVSIPLGELDGRYSELNKEKTIYVICRTGNRSDFAAKILTEKGFTDVANIVPGITEWTGQVDTIK